MGWVSTTEYSKKSELVAYLLSVAGDRLIASKSTRAGLWIVVRGDDGLPLIAFTLIKREGRWMSWKDMDERMGPFATCCPLKFFDLVPCPSDCAAEFRARCRAARLPKPQSAA